MDDEFASPSRASRGPQRPDVMMRALDRIQSHQPYMHHLHHAFTTKRQLSYDWEREHTRETQRQISEDDIKISYNIIHKSLIK